jgi:branched-chain amino acid transport system substrate-binding protein
MTGRSRSVSRLALTGVFALALVSCSSGTSDENSTSSTVSTPKPSATSRQADGTLRIGFLSPLSDPAAPFGAQLAPIFESIIEIINAFGGFNGRNVEAVIRDEGTSTERARQAVTQLITEDGVDVVVGPFSSINALSVIPALVSAGVGVCSPTVASQVLDYIDDDGLFIRTATQDIEIINDMVDLAVQSGSEKVSLAFPDDLYGRNLARTLIDALKDRGLAVLTQIAYPLFEESYDNTISQLTSDGAVVDLLIGDPVSGPQVLNALVQASQETLIITNDTLVNTEVVFDPATPSTLRPQIYGSVPDTQIGEEQLKLIFGFSNNANLSSVDEIPTYTMNTLDCLTLIWLAARSADSDDAREFQKEFFEIANDGSRCNWLFDCDFLFGRDLNLDYEGVSSLTLDGLGNAINRGTLYFTFNAEGQSELVDGLPTFTLPDITDGP